MDYDDLLDDVQNNFLNDVGNDWHSYFGDDWRNDPCMTRYAINSVARQGTGWLVLAVDVIDKNLLNHWQNIVLKNMFHEARFKMMVKNVQRQIRETKKIDIKEAMRFKQYKSN